MVDLSKLFSRRWTRRRGPYRSWRAELDAVAAGRKGMSTDWSELRDLGVGVAPALARGLVVVVAGPDLETRGGAPAARIYIARPDQLWRVPAHLALWETAFVAGPWTKPSEAMEGLLLGYTPQQRKQWLAERQERYAGESGANVYALLTRSQKDAVVAVGKRYLPDACELTVFAHESDFLLKPNAAKHAPAGTTLARFGLDWRLYRRLFVAKARRGVITATVPTKLAPAFHAAMRSNVQFLTRRGWG